MAYQMKFKEFFDKFPEGTFCGVFDFRPAGLDLVGVSVGIDEVKKVKFDTIEAGLKLARKEGVNLRGKIMLTIDGYENKKEELYEFPKVQHYCRRVFDKFPYIFYYLSDIHNSNSIFLASLCDTVSVYKKLPEANYSVYELWEKGYEPGNMPRMNLHYEVPTRVMDKIVEHTDKYAKKLGDNSFKVAYMLLSLGILPG